MLSGLQSCGQFTKIVVQRMNDGTKSPTKLNSWNDQFTNAVHNAANACLPTISFQARKIWLSGKSLDLIHQRHFARQIGDYSREKQLSAAVKISVRSDKSDFLYSMLASGSWNIIRDLRKPIKTQQGRLENIDGDTVFSNDRADTFANHLQDVQ